MLYDVVSLLFESTHVYRNTSQKYIHSAYNGYLDKRENLLFTWAVDLKLSVKKRLTIYRGTRLI
jgi:hypothetical protein